MLKEKIANKTARYGVMGLGYVGLPLGVEFAKNGFHVTGFEVDASKVEALAKGVSYIEDVPTEEVKELVDKGLFDATTDFDMLAEMDIISICVPTPLGKTRDPDMRFVQTATEAIRARLRPGQLVILESTTYPGTTEELVQPELEKTGLECGKDFFLAFSARARGPVQQDVRRQEHPEGRRRRRRRVGFELARDVLRPTASTRSTRSRARRRPSCRSCSRTRSAA